ncbi:MAG: hypothetical protein JO078_08480 [Candidatus Eremiobacteraeota bacterium]|nr:hypothetical protein [Candidatus Eremiobacteraeota bacterium]MBV9700148.1 hypothetical protein [Candidatus Eremiobacteraeota bacterium]
MEGRTRGGVTFAAVASAALLAFCALSVAWASVVRVQNGAFALLGGTPKITSLARSTFSEGNATLVIRQFGPERKILLDYDMDMEKLMHLIVVRDDFAEFMHLHPAFDATTGAFTQAIKKNPYHRYYVYADTTPRGIGQQVFRFTLANDEPLTAFPVSIALSNASVAVAPYTASLGATTLRANQAQSLAFNVSRNGAPASDLRPYLGAAAHAVFINVATLQYVHLHPTVKGAGAMQMNAGMAMAHAAAGPAMQLNLPALPAGTYKLWLQFRGGDDRVYTAPFTLLLR